MTNAHGIRPGSTLIPPTMADAVVRLYQEAARDSFYGIQASRKQLLDDIGRVNARRRSQHGLIRRAHTRHGKELVMFYKTYYPYQIYSNKLAEVALKEIQERQRAYHDVKVLDLGCGTGAIGLDIAQATDLRIDAVDIDHIAVACAKTNAMIRGATHLLDVWQSDALTSVEGPYDVIIYAGPLPFDHDNGMISTEDYKGRSLKRVLGQLPSRLSPGGQLLLLGYTDISKYMPSNLRSAIALEFESSEENYAIHRIMVK